MSKRIKTYCFYWSKGDWLQIITHDPIEEGQNVADMRQTPIKFVWFDRPNPGCETPPSSRTFFPRDNSATVQLSADTVFSVAHEGDDWLGPIGRHEKATVKFKADDKQLEVRFQ